MREAVKDWLTFEQLNEVDRQAHLTQLASDGKEAPEQPQPLSELRKLRRFNFTHLIWSGGIQNQPHLTLLEIHEVIEAEIEQDAVRQANERFKRAFGNGAKQDKLGT